MQAGSSKGKTALKAGVPVLVGIGIAIPAHLFFRMQEAARAPQVLYGIASGMLALSGFIATARSFLIFKMHECVYVNKEYQERVRSVYGPKEPVYRPLSKLDKRLGKCLWSCCLTTAALWLAALLYVPSDAVSKKASHFACLLIEYLDITTVDVSIFLAEIALGMVLYTLIVFARASVSMNRNFAAIIHEWEEASKPKPTK